MRSVQGQKSGYIQILSLAKYIVKLNLGIVHCLILQVFSSDKSVTLKMERDTRGPRMLSGAYITNAQIVRSSEYEVSLSSLEVEFLLFSVKSTRNI